ncbi:MAG: MvdD family ATP-grasp ribosomal peptide maturase [Acidobacteriota bacterium]|nr:MvdD family ATP-grasp ribosomal peptide maturase [Acidobacteriota bacterium]
MTVLIITHSNDHECTPLVVDAVSRKGGNAVCLNTDRFPTEERLVLGLGKGLDGQRLITADGEVDLDNLTSVYIRRFRTGDGLPGNMDPQLRAPSVDEARRTLFGLLFSTNAFVLDPYTNVQHAENKMLQLELARSVGLECPDTLITNNADDVRTFVAAAGGSVITKMQSSFQVFREGVEHVMFTNTLDAENLDDLAGLELCPMMFQSKVPKQLELRVTVVGTQVYAASIDSQSSEKATDDWRKSGVEFCSLWKPYELPDDVQTKILALMDRIQLNYGAMDIILTPDGRHVFIEVNPVGEWFWLDRYAGFQIADGLADLLLGNVPRRQTAIRGEV